MYLISNDCSALDITSPLLEQWYNNEAAASITITKDVCTLYNIDLPIRYDVAAEITSCTSDPTTTVTIEFTTNLVDLFSNITTTLTTNIINPTTIQFIGATPINDVITMVVSQFGYDYTITFTLTTAGVGVDDCDNIGINFISTLAVTQPNITDLLCVTYDDALNILTIPNSALIGDCTNTDNLDYGLYKVDINNQDTGCIYTDCDDILKCKVGEYIINCPNTNLHIMYYTFAELLFTPVGMNQECLTCDGIEELYQDILNLLETDCKPANDCKC